MAPINKKTDRAYAYRKSAILSRKQFFVARQTSSRLDASHSLKAADFLFRCPHTRQGSKALLGATGSISELISAAYDWEPQKPAKCNPYKEFLHNCPPSINQASFEAIVTIIYNRPPIDSPILRLTIRGINIKKILNLNIKKILSVNIKKLLNVIIKKTLNVIIKKKLKYKH